MQVTHNLLQNTSLNFGKAGDNSAKSAILFEKYSPEVVVITQGKAGGIIYDGVEVKIYPANLGVESVLLRDKQNREECKEILINLY